MCFCRAYEITHCYCNTKHGHESTLFFFPDRVHGSTGSWMHDECLPTFGLWLSEIYLSMRGNQGPFLRRVDAKTHTSASRATRRDLLAAPLRDLVRPVWWPVRSISTSSTTKIQGTLTQERLRQGKRSLGCPRLGRPARAPPHIIETRDEQHIGLEEKVKR